MKRAFQEISKTMFFATECGTYRYWYNRIKGVLKIQISRKALKAFQASAAGLRLAQYVDMFEIGGGWFEVHAGDTSMFDRFGTHTDGLKMWVRGLNEFFLHKVNCNVYKAVAVYKSAMPSYHHPMVNGAVREAASPASLLQLAAHFARG